MDGKYRYVEHMEEVTSSGLSDRTMDVEAQRFNTRRNTRSLSMPLQMNVRSYDRESELISHRGPLWAPRTSFIPMGRSLTNNGNFGNHSSSIQRIREDNKTSTKSAAEISYVSEMGQKNCPIDNCQSKSEQLKLDSLGSCNDPFCNDPLHTGDPTYFAEQEQHKSSIVSTVLEIKGYYRDAKDCLKELFFSFDICFGAIINPHCKVVQQWNKFFLISCAVASFIDPLFFFLLSSQEDNKCMVLNRSLAVGIAAARSVTDFFYFMNMFLQFRLAYVSNRSSGWDPFHLIDEPKRIVQHYLWGYFLLDLFAMLPLPQITILVVLSKGMRLSAANYARIFFLVCILLQYGPRLFRCFPLFAGQFMRGFMYGSGWVNCFINLFIFLFVGHIVGSCWYVFGLQRVHQCLRNACSSFGLKTCKKFVDCGQGTIIEDIRRNPDWIRWKNNSNTTQCFHPDSGYFSYGIFEQAVLVSTRDSIVIRYIYSLFWGVQQISTLAGNLVPSSFPWEVLFTMAIVFFGLFLFALALGNMQNFLQGLQRRTLEMQLRRPDVEQWMGRQRLPEDLRRQVREAEKFNWVATQGVHEEEILENLPENLQRDIRRHLFKFVKKVRIFTLLDDQILDAICERLRRKLYIKGSSVQYRDGPIDQMLFIARGKMKSIGKDGNIAPMSEGDVCGEELLTMCLEHPLGYTDRSKMKNRRLLSNRQVVCLTNVETYALCAADLIDVTTLFTRFLRNPRIQAAIRYESPYWRVMAATCIQVAWRYRQRRMKKKGNPNAQTSDHKKLL